MKHQTWTLEDGLPKGWKATAEGEVRGDGSIKGDIVIDYPGGRFSYAEAVWGAADDLIDEMGIRLEECLVRRGMKWK